MASLTRGEVSAMTTHQKILNLESDTSDIALKVSNIETIVSQIQQQLLITIDNEQKIIELLETIRKDRNPQPHPDHERASRMSRSKTPNPVYGSGVDIRGSSMLSPRTIRQPLYQPRTRGQAAVASRSLPIVAQHDNAVSQPRSPPPQSKSPTRSKATLSPPRYKSSTLPRTGTPSNISQRPQSQQSRRPISPQRRSSDAHV